jgi:hypothetical protein
VRRFQQGLLNTQDSALFPLRCLMLAEILISGTRGKPYACACLPVLPVSKRVTLSHPCRSTRQRRRQILLHVGPTNSGKTHSALEALAAARSGVYCGPLRLLAWEVFERLNAQGTACDLVTGQERELRSSANGQRARHVSTTVEMADVGREWGVAVLDEIQVCGAHLRAAQKMWLLPAGQSFKLAQKCRPTRFVARTTLIQVIGDESRGWAWTRVLLGMQVRCSFRCHRLCAAVVIPSFPCFCRRMRCTCVATRLRYHSFSACASSLEMRWR